MPRRRIQAATTALLAVLVATTTSQPVRTRDLQPFATGTPALVNVLTDWRARATTAAFSVYST